MSRSKFWMVLGSGEPTLRHPSRQSAKREAERLARANPGEEFVVLEAVATVAKCDLVWTQNDRDESETDDDVPF